MEFTYNDLQYVMEGDSSVALSEILDYVGLTGEVTAVEVSDESLFSADQEDGEWVVTAHKAFSTNEWMKVTISGEVYEIKVTDTNGDSIEGLTYHSEGDYYAISSTDDIKALATYVSAGNNCSDMTFKLTQNIDCSGVTWDSDYVIGSNNNATSDVKPFRGTFDGDNKTISNITTPELYFAGFFASNKGLVKNIVFENCTMKNPSSYGQGAGLLYHHHAGKGCNR